MIKSMYIERFWQEVYLAAIKSGYNHNQAKQLAADAISAYRSRMAGGIT